MLSAMEKDGLINRARGFKIKVSDGALYINGEHQPTGIYNRYSRYFDNKNIIFKGKGDNLDIRITN